MSLLINQMNYPVLNIKYRIENQQNQLASLKVKKVALEVLRGMCIVAGFSLIGLATTSIISPLMAMVSIPCLVGAIFFHSLVKAQESAIQITEFSIAFDQRQVRSAQDISFIELIRSFDSLDNIIPTRILDMQAARIKFKESLPDNISDFWTYQRNDAFRLDECTNYGIIDEDSKIHINRLLEEYESLNTSKQTALQNFRC